MRDGTYMINLVTVVYNLEQHLLRLQSESLQNYCKPLRHWVVVNEKDVDVHGWYDFIKKHYEHHELYIIPRKYLCNDPRIDEIRGWASQQVLKLLIANIVQDDYILMDAKNFLIQEFDFSMFDDLIGSGILEVQSTHEKILEEDKDFFVKPMATKEWENTITNYCKKLGISQIPTFFLMPGTPFKIHYKNIIDRIDLEKIFDDLLYYRAGDKLEELACPSEFLYYSLVCNDLIEPGINTLKNGTPIFNHTLFPESFDAENKILSSGYLFKDTESILNVDKEVKIFGLHKRYLDRCGPQHYREINYWLSNKGFKFHFA